MRPGDRIRHRPSNAAFTVACVHDDEGILYVCGHPPHRLLIESCDMLQAANDDESRAVVEALASSSGTGHRPRCARERGNQ